MSPAAALNRKFDLLAKSGTCSPYLLDVLTLLVAHANDTDLFMTELRSAPLDAAPPVAETPAAVSPPPPSDRAALRESRQCARQAAEESLRSHAADLKRLNDVAVATSSKALRAMKSNTSSEMNAFRDRVVADTVARTREELDALRMSCRDALHADAAQLKAELHQLGLRTQRAMAGVWEAQTPPRAAEAPKASQREGNGDRSTSPHPHALPRPGRGPPAQQPAQQEGPQQTTTAQSTSLQAGGTSTGQEAPNAQTTLSDGDGVRPLGMQLRDGGGDVEGLIVTDVTPNSLAASVRVGVGFIISHVGQVLVKTVDEFAATVNQSGSVVKLTIYDPQTARVRIVTIQR